MRFLVELVVVAGLILYAWETPYHERFQGKKAAPEVVVDPEVAATPNAPLVTPTASPSPTATPPPPPEKDGSWMWKPSKMDSAAKKKE